MGFEGSFGTKEKPIKSMRVTSSHKRSKSEPDKEENMDICSETPCRRKLDMGELKGSNESTKMEFTSTVPSSLKKQEIVQLEKKLQDQFVVRSVLKETPGQRSSIYDNSVDKSVPKPAEDLIKEIAVLEWEVGHLEQYLLSLYRKAFNQKISCTPNPIKEEKIDSPPVIHKGTCPKNNEFDKTLKRENLVAHSCHIRLPDDSFTNQRKDVNSSMGNEGLLDSGIYRSHSTLDQRSAYGTRNSPPENNANGIWSFHSQPLSSMEYANHTTSNATSLAEYLGTSVADHVPEAPNRISEEMIKCMSSIYCKVSDPPLVYHGLSSSPTSSLSTESVFSPQDQYSIWSPCRRKETSFDARLDNPFHLEEFSGPYTTMAEVPWICRDSQRLKDIDEMLQRYKLLVRQLEKVDPKKLKHKEKLAFWINIHNALAMHALLVYGIPQNNVKRISLILKAAYNIGGHTISADTIQSTILGCRMPRPVQWLRTLFSPKTKFKAGDSQQSYAIEHPEPLLHFALSSGSHSDPAIRMYTPKKIFQELEVAREEYVRATLGVRKEQKVVLPKTVESFAKDSSLCPASLMEMIHQSVPESLRKTLRTSQGRSRKSVEWVPHNFAFRYLISNDLVR
ncbi:hypothetical protein ACHQM5_016968 [Ranunculus cassubicifolius]